MIPVLIYPVLNRFDLLRKSLNTIDYPIGEILIINNSGDDLMSTGLVEEYPKLNIRVLNLPSNMGITGGWNLGIKLYPHAKYWMFSSADTTPSEGLWKDYAEKSGSDKFVLSANAGWNIFTVGEEIVKKIGIFDEYIYPAYYEDNDYWDRMVLGGFVVDVNILHSQIYADENGVSQTIKSNEDYFKKNNYTYWQNHLYYNAKKDSGDYTCKGWDLIRRRDHEWIPQKP
jgi:GT2 family glycosyltransferase